MEFAEKFLKLRKSAGLSQQEAAKKTGRFAPGGLTVGTRHGIARFA